MSASHQTTIAAPRRHQIAHRKAVEQWRDLIVLLVQRDLRVRYRGSFLGYLWSMMNPLLYMTILAFVFSHVVNFKVEHYPAFILSGQLSWNLFQQGMVMGTNSILANGALLRKVKVPAALFPAVSVTSVFVNFLLALFPYAIVAGVSGVPFSFWVLTLPVVVFPYLLFIYGLALTVGTINIRFRDVGHVMEPLLTMAYFATPIMYPISTLPPEYQRLLYLNPVATFVTQMRRVLFEGLPPYMPHMVAIYLLAGASLALGIVVYRKNRDGFIYNL